MTEEFVPDDDKSVSASLGSNNEPAAASEQEIVCVTVTGSPKGVRETILTLYRLGFAEVGDWSPLQPAANPKQVMSVLIRRKLADDKSSRKSGR
ncbi:hypothetical protein IQ270_27385 [Microcoleus sp. LEGE 07076]|uniref:hypothetical protein n=1 Tax=Microcoleus sp. LEGE 07076 TaxID=915322 RepID=UPI00187F2726|nr:hypothetical protein [Microcoleus sp. LEGE 07076]MBE9188261.1 hypothetical protein [Microcoleus sp. LEGE 07076]